MKVSSNRPKSSPDVGWPIAFSNLDANLLNLLNQLGVQFSFGRMAYRLEQSSELTRVGTP